MWLEPSTVRTSSGHGTSTDGAGARSGLIPAWHFGVGNGLCNVTLLSLAGRGLYSGSRLEYKLLALKNSFYCYSLDILFKI